jgi:hypothetical protein
VLSGEIPGRGGICTQTGAKISAIRGAVRCMLLVYMELFIKSEQEANRPMGNFYFLLPGKKKPGFIYVYVSIVRY